MLNLVILSFILKFIKQFSNCSISIYIYNNSIIKTSTMSEPESPSVKSVENDNEKIEKEFKEELEREHRKNYDRI